MNRRAYLIVVLVGILMAGCEKLIFKPQPDNTNRGVFEQVWKGFNEKYALFDFKEVNWDDLRTLYGNKVSEEISQDSLFNVLEAMITELRDGHSYVTGMTTDSSYAYNLFYDYENNIPIPTNIDETILNNNYYSPNNASTTGAIKYFITSDSIGYIRVPTFSGEQIDLSDIISSMGHTKGLILDVRHNGGGSPDYAAIMASHFVDRTYDCGTDAYKIGPGPNDFATSTLSINPHTSTTYTKPIAVLISRGVFSATTKLVFFLDPAPHVTFIGSRTGGGATAPADYELSNGWVMSISESEMVNFEGNHLDDGFDPDQEVWLDTTDQTKDEVIEAAFLHLQ